MDIPFSRNALSKIGLLLTLGLILLFAAYLRHTAVTQSLVMDPYRADAAVYYNSAYNLRKYGVYSHEADTVVGKATDPKPDAFVTPGYPLFLAAFVDAPPNLAVFKTVALWQTLLGTLTVLLAYLFFRYVVRNWVALIIALLIAISPQLVNTTIYLLSETLFTFWLTLALLAFTLHAKGTRWFYPGLLLTGLLFGIAALTRPVLELFPLAVAFLLFVNYPKPKAFKGSAMIFLGFLLLWGPWLARNHVSLGTASDPSLMLSSLHQGMYPGMMYHDEPGTLGYPYRFDPQYTEAAKSMSTVLTAIGQQFTQHPGKELSWYLIGKPIMLWSWNLVAGPGDIFIYPTFISPYSSFPVFIFTHALMHGLHWLLVILALAGCILVWLPYARRHLGHSSLLFARTVSLLLLYNTGVLMILSPFVRYSIPFLPFEFGMAALASCMLISDIHGVRERSKQRRGESRSRKTAQ